MADPQCDSASLDEWRHFDDRDSCDEAPGPARAVEISCPMCEVLGPREGPEGRGGAMGSHRVPNLRAGYLYGQALTLLAGLESLTGEMSAIAASDLEFGAPHSVGVGVSPLDASLEATQPGAGDASQASGSRPSGQDGHGVDGRHDRKFRERGRIEGDLHHATRRGGNDARPSGAVRGVAGGQQGTARGGFPGDRRRVGALPALVQEVALLRRERR